MGMASRRGGGVVRLMLNLEGLGPIAAADVKLDIPAVLLGPVLGGCR